MIEYLSEYKESTLCLIGPLAEENEFAHLSPTIPKIFVDGGARFQKRGQGFSIGDGDSFRELSKENHPDLDESLNPRKDFSDLAYVLSQIPSQFTWIKMFGFSGGRKDHELMNWAEVHSFLLQVQNPTRVDMEPSVLVFSKGNWSVLMKGLFSTFMFTSAQMKLSGDCEYRTDELRSLSSQGLSNQAFGEVRLTCEAPVFIFK